MSTMNENPIIEDLIVRPESALTPAPSAPATPAPLQARNEAIANLTASAYARASQLSLTPEEIKALQADFPDDAFQPGAAGNSQLIYVEHAFLRDRLNQVVGLGQWAIIPRRSWSEDFKTATGKDGIHVYVEAMLMVRGCFVGEAIGNMDYYPRNEATNYGDAYEGAKTAAFRRCAKELGIGLQAWKKDWCQGWWDRKRGTRRSSPAPAPAAPPPAPAPAPAPSSTIPHPSSSPKAPTAKTRDWMIKQFPEASWPLVTEYFRQAGQLMPNEALPELELRFVPANKEEMAALVEKVENFSKSGIAYRAFTPHTEEPAAPAPAPAAPPAPSSTPHHPSSPIQVPRDPMPDPNSPDAPWRSFPVPFGKHSGTQLGNLDKNILFGFWANFEVETEYNGKPKAEKTIARDRLFRQMLDAAGQHYDFQKND